MSTNIQNYELSSQDLQTLAQAGVIPADTPKAMVNVFATACKLHGLSPFKKEIYLTRYFSKKQNQYIYSNIVGIDGLRAKADRTGQLAGKDDARFDVMPDGSYKTAVQLIAEKKTPTTCTVTVYRIVSGHRVPFTKTVIFNEYRPAIPSDKWLSMPFNMIEKCAEAAALRMGFASETAGLHIEEESAAIKDVTVQAIGTPKFEIPAEDIETHNKVIDSLSEIDDFYNLLRFYKQFNETEYCKKIHFATLFFEAAAKTAKTKDELNSFYNESKAWHQTPQLVKILSTRKKELEQK